MAKSVGLVGKSEKNMYRYTTHYMNRSAHAYYYMYISECRYKSGEKWWKLMKSGGKWLKVANSGGKVGKSG